MSAPVQQPQGPPAVDLNTLVSTLGNAAERSAEKGAGTQDPDAAKGFGQAALAFTQALMAIMAPHVQPPSGGQDQQPPRNLSAR